MPRPLSNDLRERLVRAVENGMSRAAAARKYEVSPSCVIKIVQLWQATGSWEPKKIGGYRKAILADHASKVEKIIEEKADITLAEMQGVLAKAKIKVGQSSITRFLNHLGLSYKKKRFTPANKTGRM
jgi:transposase